MNSSCGQESSLVDDSPSKYSVSSESPFVILQSPRANQPEEERKLDEEMRAEQMVLSYQAGVVSHELSPTRPLSARGGVKRKSTSSKAIVRSILA